MSQETNKRQELKQTLCCFTERKDGSLFNATTTLLNKLGIQLDRETAEPINVRDLYDGPMPQYLTNALQDIKDTFFIGIVNDLSLQDGKSQDSLQDVANTIEHGGKYDGMFVFACDAKTDANLTRTAAAALTRAFNSIACANPVILIIRQGDLLSLATCERLEYSQQSRRGSGDKIGKVCILRNIDCSTPHPGHLDILDSLGDKRYPTFEELYKHWMEVFSSELLTKKFYSELSDWYAWAVQVARFPNDLNTREDDAKFNHEACIRLITRLIFVWFLKQKKLIPEEFFNEEYIRENLIENFNPHDRENLIYNPEKSNYYRLVLQNLFFAMLNCPIVAEGKDVANNRRFRATVMGQRLNRDYNVNNLMRYESEFMEGGAQKFVALANSSVPFLNGGLFDCLDDKPRGLYYDGFSERRESLEQLSLPDYLFFGDEVGNGIDLSQWYDDRNKRNVSARGIIDILKRYSFTVEENTPLDQEVSLDPELLGKAFENLLAAYNPETKTSARKQTGSFYTPREIVQYMVDESLVAHLKRICGDELEPEYRRLLSYATDEINLDEQQRKMVMAALYNCRVLDPACGSGAFPMGVLQQMVHVLRQLDPTNEMWKEFMIDLAIERSRQAFSAEAEEERKARLADIEEAFNRSINDPDYARKLYLIEHCIYGVDIQPIAVQISKLRFFISLVVDQKPTTDAIHNFGIRPLPNLESKFVAANTLIPVKYNGSLVEGNNDVRKYKERLRELNHKIFRAKRNVDKQHLKTEIRTTRQSLANAIEETGFVGHSEAKLLASWDMFDQNASSSYFDAEWMFGVKEGFDVVIANPPYVEAKKLKHIASTLKGLYDVYSGTADFSIYFIELGLNLLHENGELTYITTNKFFNTGYGKKLRHLLSNRDIHRIIDFEQVEVFENVLVSSTVIGIGNRAPIPENELTYMKFYKLKQEQFKKQFVMNKENLGTYPQSVLDDNEWSFADLSGLRIKAKIENQATRLAEIEGVNIYRGVTTGYNPAFIITNEQRDSLISQDSQNKSIIKNLLQGRNIRKWYYNESDENLLFIPWHFPLHDDISITGASTKAERELERAYPSIYDWLSQFKYDLSSRNQEETGIRYEWYALQRCAASYYPEFERDQKIIWGLTADKWAFTIDNAHHYLPSNGYILTSRSLSILYILGLLNSSLMKHYFGYIGVMTAGGAYTLKAATISSLPFKIAHETEIIDTMVKQILSIKENDHDADVTCLEQQIDLHFYQLYELTYDEVLIIDPETSITREEYENYKAE